MLVGLLTLIPGVPSTVGAIGLLAIAIAIAIAVGLVLVLVLSFRQSRRAHVSISRAFGRARKEGARALWEFAP